MVDTTISYGPFVGGAIGAIVAYSLAQASKWFSRPILAADHTPAGIVTISGNGRYRYARLFVTNVGRSEAKEVQALLIELRGLATEVLDMDWAHLGKNRLNIPRGVGRYIDLCRVDLEDDVAQLTLAIDGQQETLTGTDQRFVIVITSKNAAAIKVDVRVTFHPQNRDFLVRASTRRGSAMPASALL